ncbi:MAG: cell division protein FtsA [Dehalococcoidia bacterium]|nr:cell division protein FtsA [Dehalococcoidia bacterium]
MGGYVCRRNPLGMRGPTVGADSHVITASAIAAEDLRRAIEMAGKELDGLYAGGVAAAHAVLTAEEREVGTVLIDIGAGTTDVVAYAGGTPFCTFVLPVGGNQIAGDLAISLNTPAHVAERLLLEEGSATAEGVDPTDELTIRCFGPTGIRTLRRAFLIEVIRLRVEELLRMSFLQAAERSPEPFEGNVVLTGGVANLRGIEALAAGVLESHVRIGRPADASKEPTDLANPSYAAAIGAVRMPIESGLFPWKAASQTNRLPSLWPRWSFARRTTPGLAVSTASASRVTVGNAGGARVSKDVAIGKGGRTVTFVAPH